MYSRLDRRGFLKTVAVAASPALKISNLSGAGAFQGIDKRKAVLALLDGTSPPEYIPAAFFLHFDESEHFGEAAVRKHLEYFRYTGMDFVKIQYENEFPVLPEIQKPDDWSKMPFYKEDFYEPQVKVVEGLVREAKKEALVVVTLYSPFMCAGHSSGDERLVQHLHEAPEKVKKGLEIITESVLLFARACIRAGVDGFYASTQGGESNRFEDKSLFLNYIKPFDLAVMEEINDSCDFNILHVCDYNGPYDNLSPFLDYPGDVVNCSLHVGERLMTPGEAAELFERPYMGGLERTGTLSTGSIAEVEAVVNEVLDDAPDRFILGADCTVPSETSWDNLKAAISLAHRHRKKA